MISLDKRSIRKELLDADDIPFADIRQNMKELNIVNTRLGGHAISISAVKILLAKSNIGDITICEIGCGGGDNLSAIAKWCDANNILAKFVGIDIKPECIAFAQQQYPALNVTWIVSDYRTVQLQQIPAIVFSSLFCHHFSDDEIPLMLQWMHNNSTAGFFINDLHRHSVAYYLIKNITALFSRSYLVRNDAPLSVARAFKKTDWRHLFQKAGLRHYTISWRWAFRYLIICYKHGAKDL